MHGRALIAIAANLDRTYSEKGQQFATWVHAKRHTFSQNQCNTLAGQAAFESDTWTHILAADRKERLILVTLILILRPAASSDAKPGAINPESMHQNTDFVAKVGDTVLPVASNLQKA